MSRYLTSRTLLGFVDILIQRGVNDSMYESTKRCMPQRHSSQLCMTRSGNGTRVASRMFTAPRWLLATPDRTHTCDVTVSSLQIPKKKEYRSVKGGVTVRRVSIHTGKYRTVKRKSVESAWWHENFKHAEYWQKHNNTFQDYQDNKAEYFKTNTIHKSIKDHKYCSISNTWVDLT